MSSRRSAAAAERIEQRIGPELKRLREASNMSLRTLAERAGFSPSFISQVENGQVSPSIASLAHIAAVLDVTLADFFAPEEPSEVVVMRADARPSFRSSWSSARIESVTVAGRQQSLDAIMVTLDPRGTSGKRAEGTPTDQLAVVFAGRVTLTLAEDTTDLHVGDSVLIPAQTPHRWQNLQRTDAQVLLVWSRGRS